MIDHAETMYNKGMVEIEHKPYKAVISDVDGTLVGKDLVIPDPVKDAIRSLQDVGVKFLFATGRNFSGMIENACAELDITSPQITAGGAEIVDPTTREVLSAEYIPDTTLQELYNLLTERGVDFWIEKGFVMYTKGAKEYASLGPSVYKDLSEVELSSVPKLGILPVYDEGVGKELEEEMMKRFTDVHITRSFSPSGRTWDITGSMGNKQEAVLKVSRLLGIPPQEIVGIGDGYNDFPLLEACGYKVAVDNAHQELKAIANKVVPSYQDHGVAVFVQNILGSGK